MLHEGLTAELARMRVEERLAEATSYRNAPPDRRSFDHLLSLAGAGGLLVVALFGAIAAVAIAVTAAIALAITSARARADLRRDRDRRPLEEPASPEAADRWRRWRAVEPEVEYLRGPSA